MITFSDNFYPFVLQVALFDNSFTNVLNFTIKHNVLYATNISSMNSSIFESDLKTVDKKKTWSDYFCTHSQFSRSFITMIVVVFAL